MSKKAKSIPIKQIAKDLDDGIVIGQLPPDAAQALEVETEAPHRHDSHFFALHESGEIQMEIDFEKHSAKLPTLLYLNPNQVHRTMKIANDVVCYILVIDNENIKPEYLQLLEDITPVKPLPLSEKNLEDIRQAMLLCINFFERKKDKLYHPLLKDGCNALIALMISLYLEKLETSDKIPRFSTITKAFKTRLEHHFITAKRPADYANQLNISVAYLNECVKNTTGLSVSQHIQQRVILEAKRLLYHSDKSVKEIALELGYEDYPYFSRLFSKVTGTTALTFRNKTAAH